MRDDAPRLRCRCAADALQMRDRDSARPVEGPLETVAGSRLAWCRRDFKRSTKNEFDGVVETVAEPCAQELQALVEPIVPRRWPASVWR